VGELPSQTTELADAVGRAESIDALDARITICGVGDVELVAAAGPADVGVVADRVVDRERIIPRHSKDMVYANIAEPREDVLDNGFGHDAFAASFDVTVALVIPCDRGAGPWR